MVLLDVVSQPARIRCREIGTADIERIVNLLTSGFRNRTRGYWVRALKRLSEHPTPPGFPKYGYLLDCRDTPVGVILLIFSSILVKVRQEFDAALPPCTWSPHLEAMRRCSFRMH